MSKTYHKKQFDSIIELFKERPCVYGDNDRARPDSEQGKRLTEIHGKPIQNSSFTGHLARGRAKNIYKNLDDGIWVFTENWEVEYKKYKEGQEAKVDANFRRMVRELVGSNKDLSLSNKELEDLGAADIPVGSAAQKREAGCRRRAEQAHVDPVRGPRAMFTGESEWTARSASHSIEVRAVRNLADNSPSNILLLRNDFHSMRDNKMPDGQYAVEIRPHDQGMILLVNTSDLLYKKWNGTIEVIEEPHKRREMQKRLIIGNMARGISQEELPDWFIRWRKSICKIIEPETGEVPTIGNAVTPS